MIKIKDFEANIFQILGAFGTIICVIAFILQPSFPTPDKLVVFCTFVFMMVSQSVAMLQRILPFVGIILLYESFRGLVPHFNGHINYTVAPDVDKFLFGNLPTTYLQNWLWHGHVMWYDYVFYVPYMLFFALPFALAILVWKTRIKYYWQAVTSYSLTFLGGFLTFLLFPAAPPWMASDQGAIQQVRRISTDVWDSLGIHNFPSVYNHIAPNPVAAVPSLHSACATLFSIYIFKLYGRRWGAASLIYPFLIYIGVIYQGEHYAFDVIVGIIYAVTAYLATPWVIKKLVAGANFCRRKLIVLKQRKIEA